MSSRRAVRVLIVDDSPTVRAVLRRLFAADSGTQVVAEAENGEQALAETLRVRPDVVIMDVEMPVLDGFAATEKIMATRPTPILVLTSLANRDQMHTAFEAMRCGALDVLAKPENTDGWRQLARTLPEKVRVYAQSMSVLPVRGASPGAAAGPAVALPALRVATALRYVAIGASTGGPGAVRDFLEEIPLSAPATILIVQHIATGFEAGMVEWLRVELGLDVALARDGEIGQPGTVRLAPSGAHLRLEPGGRLRLDTSTPPRRGHRPAVDELFLSCAHAHPRETAGLLFSGMGADGAEGLSVMRKAGALTLVQDEASSAVFGMPRAALEAGAAEIALPPRELARALLRTWQGGVR